MKLKKDPPPLLLRRCSLGFVTPSRPTNVVRWRGLRDEPKQRLRERLPKRRTGCRKCSVRHQTNAALLSEASILQLRDIFQIYAQRN